MKDVRINVGDRVLDRTGRIVNVTSMDTEAVRFSDGSIAPRWIFDHLVAMGHVRPHASGSRGTRRERSRLGPPLACAS